jgi:hypothetical protein
MALLSEKERDSFSWELRFKSKEQLAALFIRFAKSLFRRKRLFYFLKIKPEAATMRMKPTMWFQRSGSPR